MQRTAALELDPVSLPEGAQVVPWRVEGWGGRGTYGAVYRAVRVGREEAGWVALNIRVALPLNGLILRWTPSARQSSRSSPG